MWIVNVFVHLLNEKNGFVFLNHAEKNQKLKIYWDGVKSIRNFENIENFCKPPPPKEVAAMVFNKMEDYKDAVVVPWYKQAAETEVCFPFKY